MAFMELGELLEALHDTENSDHRAAARSALTSDVARWMPCLLQATQNKNPEIRYRAAAGLAELGHAAQEATPTVVALLGDENEWVRYYACYALGEIRASGPKVTGSLCEMAVDGSWHVRQAAIDAVAKLAFGDENVVRALVQALDDNDFRVRCSAVEAIGTLRIWKREMLAPFEKILANSDEWGQREAITVLGEADAPADWAILHATRLLDNVDPLVRHAAAKTLSRYGAAATHAIPRLLENLATPTLPDYARDAMRSALRAIGKESIQSLLIALKDGRPLLRAEAARLLGDLGDADSAILMALRRVMVDNEDLVRVCAAGAIWRLTGDTTDPFRVLVDGLKSADLRAIVYAATILGNMGPKGRPAIDELNNVVVAGSSDARCAATVALIRLTRRDDANIPSLIKLLDALLEGDDCEVRQIAARGLGLLRQPTPEVIATLERHASSDWDSDVQAAAMRSLKRLTRQG